MLKLGMKPVTGVGRVTIKRTKNVKFCLISVLVFTCIMNVLYQFFLGLADIIFHLKA